ncbi:hypothetical protein BT69DRAFT_1347645 [Atractiella rhizophila]|nr:hypothetical protein BT69DRAFT_1347645 [Atractiella rhizophila]
MKTIGWFPTAKEAVSRLPGPPVLHDPNVLANATGQWDSPEYISNVLKSPPLSLEDVKVQLFPFNVEMQSAHEHAHETEMITKFITMAWSEEQKKELTERLKETLEQVLIEKYGKDTPYQLEFVAVSFDQMSNPSSLLLAPPKVTLGTTPPLPSSSSSLSPSLNGNSASLFQSSPSRLSAQQPLQIHSTFSPHATNRGKVVIKVEDAKFYCHKDVLVFGSSFFEALLLGGPWRETTIPERGGGKDKERELEPQTQIDRDGVADEHTDGEDEVPNIDRLSLDVTPSPPMNSTELDGSEIGERVSVYSREDLDFEDDGIEARLHLKEEKAASFQDLLFFIYPHLDCCVTWNNAPDLMTMSLKFDMPLLKRLCTSFLISSAAGQPIKAMKISEDHQIPELYKEASRFLLDNFNGWDTSDLAVLKQSTLLKLEKRRTWFLERLLKLGLVTTARDYVCSPSCPDPQTCAKLLDEKWRSAWNAAFRFGPPQPSIIYRSLRQLEPSLSSPALHLPHTACQAHARAWVADLFDRMFSLAPTVSPRGWSVSASAGYSRTYGLYGTGGAGGIGGDTAGSGSGSKGAKYFLFITMDPEH